MPLTEDQILSLAPDEASKKSGKHLSNISKWVSKGANETAVWGEAHGSGSKPYQTQADLANVAFKCSCPSRKFPCKHGIGLLLLYARQQQQFTDSTPPSWVTDWLSKRTDKQEKAAVKEDKPVDEAAQAKRLQARQQKVQDGIGELLVWIKDIVRNGILSMPDKGYPWFEHMAKRMVDAQAPGLANMIRTLGETSFYKENWQTNFTNQLLDIYLIIEGYKNKASLDVTVQAEIKTRIGFTQNQEALKEQTGITDIWFVLAKQTTEVDTITTERNWLLGVNTQQCALVMQFLVRGQGAQLTLTPGTAIQAELVYYQAAVPLRAMVKQQSAAGTINNITKYNGWLQVLETESNNSSLFPVKNERPYVVKQLKPVQYENQWWLQDSGFNMMRLRNEQATIWHLLSLSGGSALDMVVIGSEDQYEPMGVWYNGHYKTV